MKKKKNYDKLLLGVILALTFGGFLISLSAFLPLQNKNVLLPLSIDMSQSIAVVLGLFSMLVTSKIHYKNWRRYALLLFSATLIFSALVFVPGLGLKYGGAVRWLNVGPFSVQPAEFLKISFVIYFASWLAASRDRLRTFNFGFLPYVLIIAVVGGVMLTQKDTGTFFIIYLTSLVMFLTAGGKWKHFFLLAFLAVLGVVVLAFYRPYLKERMITFFNPYSDTQNAGWQLNQSLIAIGSGGLLGRGFGQSVQKFKYLPESESDSIFAVAGEEFGFVGTVAIVLIFTVFALAGLKTAARAPDQFGKMLAVGITGIIISGAFINISAMLGLMPLTGVPLPFISHGGTALVIILAASGILLNISSHGNH